MTTEEPAVLVEVKDLRTYFHLAEGTVRAVDGVDLIIRSGRTLGVVVANHSSELNRLKNRPRIYFAQSAHAAGILEGIEYYNFMEKIVIPNDRIE